jgi:hypothetical protein
MGVPSEGGEDSDVDENDEPRPTDSTEYGLPTVDADQAGGDEGEQDTTSTQFGLPSVDEGGEVVDPDDETPTPVPDEASGETPTPVPDDQAYPSEETPTPVPQPSGEDDPQRTGNWTGWEEDVGDEPSEESVMSAWGISSDEEGSSPESPDQQAKYVTQEFEAEPGGGQEESPVVEGKLKTQMGMPQVDRPDGEPSSPTLADVSSPTRRETESVGSDKTEEFQIDSMDELERQVRDLRTESEVEETDEEKPEEADTTADAESSGAGIVSKPDESDTEPADSGVVSGAPGLESDSEGESGAGLGPGAYSNSAGDDQKSSGVLGGGTYQKNDVEPDESGGLPSPSEIDAGASAEGDEAATDPESSAETRDNSSGEETDEDGSELEDNSVGKATQAGRDDVTRASESSEAEGGSPDDSGLGADREGPTGFAVDRSDDELSVPDGVQGEAGQRLGDSISDDDGSETSEEADDETELDGDSQTTDGGDGDETTNRSEGESADESGPEHETVDGDEVESGGEDERPASDSPDREPNNEETSRTAAESASDADTGESGATDSGEAARETGDSDDDLSRYAMLTQTVCGLIAGISFGMAVLVQLLTGGTGAEILLLSLMLASGIGTVASIVLPFVPLGGALRGALYLGFGVLVAALGVSSMVAGGGGLAVGPIVALFGSIFAVVAGAVPHVVLALEE